jgi:hypothetical protein
MSLPHSFRNPPAARSWTLCAARDFSATISFIRHAHSHTRLSADHVGSLIGAVISYARPFKNHEAGIGQHPDPKRCFMDLAIDLGADLALHGSILETSRRLIARASPPAFYPAKNLSERPVRVHCFDFPDVECDSIARRYDLDSFVGIARLMRLACVFLLAEIDPAPFASH